MGIAGGVLLCCLLIGAVIFVRRRKDDDDSSDYDSSYAMVSSPIQVGDVSGGDLEMTSMRDSDTYGPPPPETQQDFATSMYGSAPPAVTQEIPTSMYAAAPEALTRGDYDTVPQESGTMNMSQYGAAPALDGGSVRRAKPPPPASPPPDDDEGTMLIR